jgi:DNA-binding CsgD family transcriptional regulator
VIDDRAGAPGFTVGVAWPAGPPELGDRCPACGSTLPDDEQAVNGIALQATVPQPILAALRLIPLLSERERSVFHLLGSGYDNRAIAHELSTSERTVKRHVTAILTKLRLESRLQAGLAALIISSPSSSWDRRLAQSSYGPRPHAG